MALGTEVGLGPGHIVVDGDPAPLPKKGAEAPMFGPFLLWPNGWMDQDDTWHGGRPRFRRHCVRWGPSSIRPSAHVYCGQTAGRIKMALGTEVGLGPGHIVVDGDAAPLPKKGAEAPMFGPFLLWPNGWMDQYGTWHGGRPWSRPHCARWGPSPSPKWPEPPIFGQSPLWPNVWMN